MAEDIKILIADDEEMVVTLLEATIKPTGYKTFTASDGKETLDVVERERPQVVLLDINMPELNGIDACRKLRENAANASMAIIMLTGWAEESKIVQALESGADDYIAKPFNNDELVKKLNDVLEKAQAGRLPSQLKSQA